MCQGSFQGSKVGKVPGTDNSLLTQNKALLQPGTEMQCKSFGNKPKVFGRIILRTEHARLSATDNLSLTAAAQKHHNDHIIWPPKWHRSEGHQWWPEQANYHSTDLLPLRGTNPSPGSTWAHCPYLDGKVDKTTDIEWILHQVKYELHVLYQRQVVWHSQSKAGDLFQDITRYLQVQDNTQYYLPFQKSLSRLISFHEAALSNTETQSGPKEDSSFEIFIPEMWLGADQSEKGAGTSQRYLQLLGMLLACSFSSSGLPPHLPKLERWENNIRLLSSPED